MNESRFIWLFQQHRLADAMSYVFEFRHVNEPYLIDLSHVSYVRVTSHMSIPTVSPRESDELFARIPTCEWAIPHRNESCLICMSHVSYDYTCSIASRIESAVFLNTDMWMSHTSQEWVMPHMNESLSHMYESRLVCLYLQHRLAKAMSCSLEYRHTNKPYLIEMSHASYVWVTTHMTIPTASPRECDELCFWIPTCEWAISHRNDSCLIWMSHVSYDYICSIASRMHIWVSHVSYEWVMSHMHSLVSDDYTYPYVYTCSIASQMHIWMGRVSYKWMNSHMHESHLR